MNCKKCGTPVTAGQKFCGTCGEPVTAPAPETATEFIPNPVAEPISQPAPEPATEFIPRPVAEPVSQPVTEPATPFAPGNNTEAPVQNSMYAGNYQQAPYQQAPYQQPPYQQPAPEANNGYDAQLNQNANFGKKPREPKKKRKSPLVIIIVLVAIAALVAAGIIFAPKIKKLFMTESEKVAMYDGNSLESVLDKVLKLTDGFKTPTGSGNIDVKLSDRVKDYVSEYIGDVSEAKVSFDIATEGDNLGCKMVLFVGKTEMATVNMVIDTKDEMLYIELPGLVDGALEVDLYDYIDVSSLTALSGSFTEVKLTREVIDDILAVVDAAYSDVEDIEESKGTLKVDGVSQKCTVYTLEIDDRVAEDMATSALEQLKDSENLKDFIYDFICATAEAAGEDSMSKKEFEREFEDLIDDLIDEIEYEVEYLDEEPVIYELYVDSKDNVIGRIFSFEDAAVKLVCAKNGKEVAFEYSISDSSGDAEEGVMFAGSGTEDKNGFTGSAVIYTAGSEVFNFEFENFKFEEDVISGTVELSFGDDIGDLTYVDDYTLDLISTIELKLDLDMTSENIKVAIGISAMNMKLGTITIDGTGKTKYKAEISGNVEYDDPESFGSNLDLNELLERLEKSGLDLEALIALFAYGY